MNPGTLPNPPLQADLVLAYARNQAAERQGRWAGSRLSDEEVQPARNHDSFGQSSAATGSERTVPETQVGAAALLLPAARGTSVLQFMPGNDGSAGVPSPSRITSLTG